MWEKPSFKTGKQGVLQMHKLQNLQLNFRKLRVDTCDEIQDFNSSFVI